MERALGCRATAVLTMDHRDHCRGALEWHVSYDMNAAGYRGEVRCACSAILKLATKVREHCRDAAVDARLLMETHARAGVTINPRWRKR